MSAAPEIEILAELDAGGTGVVEHGVLREAHGSWPAGSDVAVKRLLPAVANDPVAREAFRSEARIAHGIEHPGLVRVLWEGEDERGPLMVMAFVPGRTLREVLEDSTILPEPVVRSVARQVAGALAALHAAGVVHGDIKPENVRLDAEGRAVLVDLGFAHRPAERGADPRRAGSLAYLSPEQARGDASSAAADVFSLGIVLYELATGSHPFVEESRELSPSGSSGRMLRRAVELPGADVLLASLCTARFDPPSRRFPPLSPFLDRVLQEMLEREPRRRPDAEQVARRFEEQESGAWWRSAIDFGAGSRRGSQSAADALHLTPLVGREQELAALEARFRSLRELAPADLAERGAAGSAGDRTVWLVGGEGSGKSRLVSDFVARVRTLGSPPLYLYGRCSAREESRPCAPILGLVQRYLHLPPDAAPGRRELELLGELLPRAEAESVARALDPEFEGTTPVAVPVALAAWLAALGARGPLIVFLDDVHHAGEGTAMVLSLLAQDLPRTHLMLVLGIRPGEPVRETEALARLAERLGGDWESSRAGAGFPLRIELGPLDAGAVRELVDRLFATSAPRLRLADVLHSRSRGNPGLLAEILRGALQRGDVRPGEGDEPQLELTIAPERLPLPASLQTVISERYGRLPDTDRRWLRRLAVAGGRLDAEFLARAFPESGRHEIDQVFSELVHAGWLVATGDRYRFARPALREAIYRTIPEERRVELHARAAEALSPGRGKRLPLKDAFQRAFHLRAARDHIALLRVLRPLLGFLMRRGQPQRVRSLATWGLEALDALPRTRDRDRLRIEVLEAAADAADRLGHRAEQRTWLDRLSDLDLDPVTDREPLARVYLLHARYAVSTGQFGLARGMLRNAVELTRSGTRRELRSEALRRLAAVQAHVGELDEARRLTERALEETTHDAQRAVAFLQLGVVDLLEDRIGEALRAVDRALTLLRQESGWRVPGAFAAAHLLRGRIYRVAGRPRRALGSMDRAVKLARQAGQRRLEIEAGARFGGLLLDANQPEEAEAYLREALLSASEIEDLRGEALASLWLAILLFERDDPEASPVLKRAERLAEEMGLNRVHALALAVRARMAWSEGRGKEAGVAIEKAFRLLGRHGAELADRVVIEGTRALVLEGSGRAPEAEEIVSALRQRMQRENQRLGNTVLRQRHRVASRRLLEAVLSTEGVVYPRIDLPWGRGPLVPRPGASSSR